MRALRTVLYVMVNVMFYLGHCERQRRDGHFEFPLGHVVRNYNYSLFVFLH